MGGCILQIIGIITFVTWTLLFLLNPFFVIGGAWIYDHETLHQNGNCSGTNYTETEIRKMGPLTMTAIKLYNLDKAHKDLLFGTIFGLFVCQLVCGVGVYVGAEIADSNAYDKKGRFLKGGGLLICCAVLLAPLVTLILGAVLEAGFKFAAFVVFALAFAAYCVLLTEVEKEEKRCEANMFELTGVQ